MQKSSVAFVFRNETKMNPKFKQSDWTKQQINFNTGKIKNATICFEKDFFKLMIHSVYGKIMENP